VVFPIVLPVGILRSRHLLLLTLKICRRDLASGPASRPSRLRIALSGKPGSPPRPTGSK
jgi:hypothetical protein